MNQSNDENLTPMIIMRKKSSLVNLNDKREKISSSVEIRGKLSNYTFSVKDEKNFFDKISRNIKVIKNYKIPKVNDRSINKKISSPILISGQAADSHIKNKFPYQNSFLKKGTMDNDRPEIIQDKQNLSLIPADIENKGTFQEEKSKSKEYLTTSFNKKYNIIFKEFPKNLKENVMNSMLEHEPLNELNFCKKLFSTPDKDNLIIRNKTGFRTTINRKSIDLSYYTNNFFYNLTSTDKPNNNVSKRKLLKSNSVDSISLNTEKLTLKENLSRKQKEIANIIYKMCLICDTFIISQFHNMKCCHIFCLKCLKNFLEEKIEQGDKTVKCPVHKCLESFSNEELQSIISNNHYKKIEKSSKIDIFGTTIKKNSNTKGNVMSNLVNRYQSKHVLDINSSESIFIFKQNKEHYCINCFEPTLFGKNGSKYLKCLNCFFSVCKFCLKSFDCNHFDKSSFNYCRVYYRKKMSSVQFVKDSIILSFLQTLALYIISYFVVYIGIICYFNTFYNDLIDIVNESSNIKYYLKLLSLYLFTILLLLILIPIFMIILPFFPVLLILFK